MADRHDVHPHHLLRAVLTDRGVRDVLAEVGTDAGQLLLTLDRRWLAAADTIEVEEVEALGIELATVLAAINPPFDEPPQWDGRHLTDVTRELLVRALALRGVLHGPQLTASHVLLALLSCREPIVAGTFREHGLTGRAVRRVVDRRGRRS